MIINHLHFLNTYLIIITIVIIISLRNCLLKTLNWVRFLSDKTDHYFVLKATYIYILRSTIADKSKQALYWT